MRGGIGKRGVGRRVHLRAIDGRRAARRVLRLIAHRPWLASSAAGSVVRTGDRLEVNAGRVRILDDAALVTVEARFADGRAERRPGQLRRAIDRPLHLVPLGLGHEEIGAARYHVLGRAAGDEHARAQDLREPGQPVFGVGSPRPLDAARADQGWTAPTAARRRRRPRGFVRTNMPAFSHGLI